VFILKTLNLFRINTYKKHRGREVLLLTRNPMRISVLSERSESKDLSSTRLNHFHPERPLVPSVVEGSEVEGPLSESDGVDFSWYPLWLSARHQPLATVRMRIAPRKRLR
jgi:hypothetical protein